MKNLLTALKKLGKKMTGDDVTGSDLVTVVDNIADGYTGGGGSGGGAFIITLTGSEDDGYAMDKTFDEILEAYQNGGVLYVHDATNSTPSGDMSRSQPNMLPLVQMKTTEYFTSLDFATTMVTQIHSDEPNVVETICAGFEMISGNDDMDIYRYANATS